MKKILYAATSFGVAGVITLTMTSCGSMEAPGAGHDKTTTVASSVGSTWSLDGHLPRVVSGHGVAALDGRILIFGGYDGTGGAIQQKAHTLFYTPGGAYDDSPQDMPDGRANMGFCTHGGKAWAIAGYREGAGQWGRTTTVWSYDPTSDSWGTECSLPYTRANGAAAGLGDGVYTIGGHHEDTGHGFTLSRVERYNPDVGCPWNQVDYLNLDNRVGPGGQALGRSGLGAVVVDGQIYAVGGGSGEARVHPGMSGKWLEVYDPATSVWTTLPEMATPRNAAAVAAVGDRIYAIGGEVSSGVYTDTVEYYDVSDGQWHDDTPFPFAVVSARAVAVNGKLYVVGGRGPTGLLNTVYVMGAGGPSCGDGTCDVGENTCSCPDDCPGSCCGDGVCGAAETHEDCPADCDEDPLRALLRLLNADQPYYRHYMDYDDVAYENEVNGPAPFETSVSEVNADIDTTPDVWMRTFPWTFRISLEESGFDGNAWYRGSGNVTYVDENGGLNNVPYTEFVIRPLEWLQDVLPGDPFGLIDLLQRFSANFSASVFSSGWYAQAPLFMSDGYANIVVHNTFGAEWPVLQSFNLPVGDTVNAAADTLYYDPETDLLMDAGDSFRSLSLGLGYEGGSDEEPFASFRIPGAFGDLYFSYSGLLHPAVGIQFGDSAVHGLVGGAQLDIELGLQLEVTTQLPFDIDVSGSGNITYIEERVFPFTSETRIRSPFETNVVYADLRPFLPAGRMKLLPITVEIDVDAGPWHPHWDQTFLRDSLEFPFGFATISAGSPINMFAYDEAGARSGYDESLVVADMPESAVDRVREEIVVGPSTRQFTVAVEGNMEALLDSDYDLTIIFPVMHDLANGDRQLRHVEYKLSQVTTFPGDVDYVHINIDLLSEQISSLIVDGGLEPGVAIDTVLDALDVDGDGISDRDDTSIDAVEPPTMIVLENVTGIPSVPVTLSARLLQLDQPVPDREVIFSGLGTTFGAAMTNANGVASLVYNLPGDTGLGFADIAANSGSATGIATLIVSNNTPTCGFVWDLIGCEGNTALVQLDGSGSTDVDGHSLDYIWSTDCPGALVTNVQDAHAVLEVDAASAASECGVMLKVQDLWASDTCGMRLTLPQCVEIDIKPGSDPNSINLGSHGVIPVAILTTDVFDAMAVDPNTVALAGSGVAVRGNGSRLLASHEDVDDDGDLDLMLHVETENLNLETGSTEAVLTARTYDGELVSGSDTINIVGD